MKSLHHYIYFFQAPQIGTPPASLYNSSQTPSLNNSQTFTGNTIAGMDGLDVLTFTPLFYFYCCES